MKKLLPAAAALALLVSCAPPFNLDYSRAAVVLGRMTKESEVGPLANYYTGSFSANAVFYPEKTTSGVDASRGFYYTTDAGMTQAFLGFEQPDGLGGFTGANTSFVNLFGTNVQTALGTGQSVPPLDPGLPPLIVVPVMTGDVVAFAWIDPQNPLNGGYYIGQAAVSSGSLSLTGLFASAFSSYVGFGSPPQAMGLSIFPSGGTDTVYILMRDTATGLFQDGMATLDSTSGLFNAAIVFGYGPETLGFIPATTTRVMYYHDPASGSSYASFLVGGAWQCWKWWYNAGVLTSVQLTGVTTRVDALLSTGELFSTQGGVGRVYDSGGRRKTSFPLGTLSFAYEEYVNGSPRMFFCLPIQQQKNGGVSVAVYSLATSDLDSLSF